MISRALAVAMVNADTSGLNDNEVEKIKDFPDFTVTNWHEESSDINGRCSITGKYTHCVEVEFNTPAAETFNTSRFGLLSYLPEDVIAFEAGGLFGFTETTFMIVDPQDATCILWLQSIQTANLAFPLLRADLPFLFVTKARLALKQDEKAYFIMTIPNNVTEMTINTRAPIIINAVFHKAWQCIQTDKVNTEVNRQIYSELKHYLVTTNLGEL